LRTLANEYGAPITYGDIQRVLRGKFSKRANKRAAFGLPALVFVSACKDCGEGHAARSCPKKRKPRKKLSPTAYRAAGKDTRYCRTCRAWTDWIYDLMRGWICGKCGNK